jgi:biotin carboxylase
MKKVAIIGASYLQLPVYLKAHELGIQTIGFAWTEGAVAKDHCDVFYPVSIVEKDLILEICQKERINGILSIASDVAVTTVNYVASKMGLTGNSIESASYCTNKFLMRERLKIAGLNCPEYFLIKEKTGIDSVGNKIIYPAIVKPVDRSGSKGVTKVLNATELEAAVLNALESSLCKQAIVEEFIEGVEVSVEMISFNGIHYDLAITDKETSGAPHFVELAHHQPSQLPQNIQKEIFAASIKGLDALDIKNGASHPEFIISSNGIFVTEIGARMGGDFIGSDLVYLSTGYDFLKGVIQVALGHFEIPQPGYKNHAGVYFYSSLTKHVREFIDKKDQQHIIRSEINSKGLVPLKESADRAGYFIYQDNTKLLI